VQAARLHEVPWLTICAGGPPAIRKLKQTLLTLHERKTSMARKVSSETMSGYFRTLFDEHPEWLTFKSNALIVERWKTDHPGKEMTLKYKQSMANVKSTLRKKLGKRRRRRKDKDNVLIAGAVRHISSHTLDQLEYMIDDCLSLARTLKAESLDTVVRNLRKARNEVVWLNGQP
jgi:hypothetical protein